MNKSWRCFHCDQLFTNEIAARIHFGDGFTVSACQLNAMEGGILELYRQSQRELREFQVEDNASFREFHRLGAEHARKEREAEEAGYAKGLRDGTYDNGVLDGKSELLPTLRRLAIKEHVRLAYGGGIVTTGYGCGLCKLSWTVRPDLEGEAKLPTVETHAAGCILNV